MTEKVYPFFFPMKEVSFREYLREVYETYGYNPYCQSIVECYLDPRGLRFMFENVVCS